MADRAVKPPFFLTSIGQISIVIAGFNTDVEFDGVVYHVQTEDKGLSAKKIISLVYDGGTILASKRTPYDDLANGNFDEKILAERVNKQHKLICAAVRAGRIAELKQMTAKAAAAQVTAAASPEAVPEPAIMPAMAETVEIATVASGAEMYDAGIPKPFEPPTYVQPAYMPEAYATNPAIADSFDLPEADPFADAPIFDAVCVIEEEMELPAEAVEVVSELSGRERPANSKLGIELLGEIKFKGGDRQTVSIMVCRGTGRKVVSAAQIMIKVLGSSFRPVIFHAKSDSNGIAKVHLQLPHFQAGRAALLIRAMDSGEEIELRRIVTPG
jgi:hypothetical protein